MVSAPNLESIASSGGGRLAPPPDFRYVGLSPTGPRAWASHVAGAVGAAATVGAALAYGCPSRELLVTALAATSATVALRRLRVRRSRAERKAARGVSMAIVPWGILVDAEDRQRVLRWAAVRKVDVDTVFGSDAGDSSALWSVVTVETHGESLTGRAPGAVPLERLTVHVEAYADEAAHVAALDLGGEQAGEGPLEPQFEPLLGAARAYLQGAPASSRLSLPPGGYRASALAAANDETVGELRGVLRDRVPRPVDPRAFAAVLAAELHATPLAPDLVELVQCPHPFIAAVAKVAATKLGVARARVGALDEVAPFLMDRDLAAMGAWSAA